MIPQDQDFRDSSRLLFSAATEHVGMSADTAGKIACATSAQWARSHCTVSRSPAGVENPL